MDTEEIEYYTPEQKAILNRSITIRPASNYENAIDLDVSKNRSLFTKIIDTGKGNLGFKILPTFLSNCTLTATQWVNPKYPIARAQTIIDNGNKFGYYEIPEKYTIPGDLLIFSNKKNNIHHTTLISGFTNQNQKQEFNGHEYFLPKEHPLLRYSAGYGHYNSFRNGIGANTYINNSGGKTQMRYYRHFKPGVYKFLPEIIVTPNETKIEDAPIYYLNVK